MGGHSKTRLRQTGHAVGEEALRCATEAAAQARQAQRAGEQALLNTWSEAQARPEPDRASP